MERVKTTVVETLLGFRRPTSGSVRLGGLDPYRDPPRGGGTHRCATSAWGRVVPHDPLSGTSPDRRVLPRAARTRGVAHLASISPTGARTPWRRLSGGEQQRTLLALALIGRPRILLLDEPTTAVDPEGRQVIRELVRSERNRGCAILITTHELGEAEQLADRIVIMNRAAW